ncbi:MAG: hypothetical protein AB7E08_05810, partial [Candidatus Omnitrophota bacterium]
MRQFIRRGIIIFALIFFLFSPVSQSSSLNFLLRRTRDYQTSYEKVRFTLVGIFQEAAKLQEALRTGSLEERQRILQSPELRIAISCLQYGLSLGSRTLRNQVASLAEKLGIKVNPEQNIGIYQGESEIFDILGNIFLTEEGGLIFYQKGTSNPEELFKPFLDRYGAEIVEFDPYLIEHDSIHSDSSELSGFESLIYLGIKEGKSPRFIYLNGKGLTETQARRIYAMAEQYNLIIIENITDAGPEDYLLSAHDPQGRVIAIGNFDRYLGEANPLSYAIAGEEIMRFMEIAIGGISLHPNAFLQPIVSGILSQNGIPYSVNVSHKPV